LNYGYAILRAATARALAGSGLLATLGIHHRNKYNSFCLADDIMEPYRPLVDEEVYQMYHAGMDCLELGKTEKAALLKILTKDVIINEQTSPLMVALSKTTASLAKCFEGTKRNILYPTFRL
jgi:CRISPR-associated protein Cas1